MPSTSETIQPNTHLSASSPAERGPLLFVVEDDPALREMLAAYLQQQGYRVTTMASAEDFLRRIERSRPDLVVLDVGLPGQDGLQACARLRATGDRLPVVLLTARSEAVDRIVGLEIGADDYLGKPFSARELLARIKAVLRRAPTAPGVPRGDLAPTRMGRYTFMPASRCLQSLDEVRVLSTLEYALLAELVASAGQPVSRERLLSATHGEADAVLPRTIDVAVMRLRKLLEPDPAEPRYIQTVRGRGYMFVPAGSGPTELKA